MEDSLVKIGKRDGNVREIALKPIAHLSPAQTSKFQTYFHRTENWESKHLEIQAFTVI